MADFFNSMDHLDPRCTKCEIKIILDDTAIWSDEKENYVCKECGTVVEHLPAF